jgi:hypothetical protein
MQNYTAIALLTLLGITSIATPGRAVVSSVELLEVANNQYMLSAKTRQRRDRSPQRGDGRRDFMDSNIYSDPL